MIEYFPGWLYPYARPGAGRLSPGDIVEGLEANDGKTRRALPLDAGQEDLDGRDRNRAFRLRGRSHARQSPDLPRRRTAQPLRRAAAEQ